jgi:hypothetical protein
MSNNQYPPVDPGQPGYGQQSGQAQPPYSGQPGYGPPPHAQPPYPPQAPPAYPLQAPPAYPPQGPGYPPQGPPPAQYAPGHYAPGQYAPAQYAPSQYPTGGQPGPWGPASSVPQGAQQWGPSGPTLRRQNRRGGNRIIFLAGGAFAVVAVVGIVAGLVVGDGDDKQAGPSPLPSNGPSKQATAAADEGIDAGNGVFVKPAAGYLRKSSKDVKGVYLVKQGEATFWLQVVKGNPGESGASIIPRLMDSQRKSMTSGTFKQGEVKQDRPAAGRRSNVTLVTSQSWQGSVTNQSVTTNLVGFIAIIDTKNGVVSAVQVTARKDHEAQLTPEIEAMLQSVVKSQ